MLCRLGGPRECVGHFTSIAFPTLGNLTNSLCPRVGAFDFFFFLQGGMEPNLIITCARLCGHLEIVLAEKNTGILEVSNSLQLIKQLLLTTHFQHKLMEHLSSEKSNAPHLPRVLSLSHFPVLIKCCYLANCKSHITLPTANPNITKQDIFQCYILFDIIHYRGSCYDVRSTSTSRI